MSEVLHITAHLGGGVGKVLSRIVECSCKATDSWKHTIACLEVPQKAQPVSFIESCGGEVLICPSYTELDRRIAQADIVQVEWWHHPVMAKWLCSGRLPAMRLLIWSHVSGLYTPEIPASFLSIPHRFLFSSHCSLRLLRKNDYNVSRGRLGIVYSSGGFDDLPLQTSRDPNSKVRFGYLGALNYAKLHPNLIDFIAAVNLPDFCLSMFGDPTTAEDLKKQAAEKNVSERIAIKGYSLDVASELANLDILVHLLNPQHYGTAENALLEAMAMGVVPIVLNNPAENCLVQHGKTGIVINSPAEFTAAVAWLVQNPSERQKMSMQTSRLIRQRFSIKRTHDRLKRHYAELSLEPKRHFDCRPIFGVSPADWFMSCQGKGSSHFLKKDPSPNRSDQLPYFLFEKTKGSVFHYRDTFPHDARLQHWARDLMVAR